MQHRLLVPAVLVTFVATAFAQSPGGGGGGGEGRRPRGDRRDAPPPAELKNVTFQEAKFTSTAVGKDMPYGVYLPKDYDDAKNKDVKWPLVIWLHGMWEDHMRFQVRGGAPVLDAAIGDGLLPPCVFVLADAGRTSMYINAGDKKNWQDLVQKDLLEHVTKTYRVSDRRDQRALMGISMGGMAALRIGFTHPDVFGTIAVHSSAVFPADPAQLPEGLKKRASDFGLDEVFGNPIDEKLWRATNPLGVAESLDGKSLHDLRIYFDAGTDDRFQFGKTNTMLHETLDKKGIAHTWELVQGGGHAWGSGFDAKVSLAKSLKFVGDGFKANGAKDGKAKPAEGSAGKPDGTGDAPKKGD